MASVPRDIPGPDSLPDVLDSHREELRQLIAVGLDRRILQRVDASDVIQETYLEAVSRLREYLDDPQVPIHVWLRFLAHQKMLQVQQRHLGVQARDPRREQRKRSNDSSLSIIAQLASNGKSPSRVAENAELRARLQLSLAALENIDREVLLLRHYRQLKNGEVARVLGLTENAASKRYFRALRRIQQVMLESSDR